MKANRFFGMFPVPRSLKMAAAGIDISDRSLKFFQLIENKGKLKSSVWEEVELPAGVVDGGRIIAPEKIKSIINDLTKKYNFNFAVVSLPEDRAYTLQLSLPLMKKNELRSSISFQLEEYVPLSPEEMVFDYKIISEPTKAKKALTVAVSVLPSSIVAEYAAVFEGTKVTPVAFEIEAQAMSRALLSRDNKEVSLIVDIGRVHAGFFIARHEEVLFASIANNIGGDDIDSILMRELKISAEEAEKTKNEIGLNRSEENKKAFFALMPVITAIKDEISQRIEYWCDRGDFNPYSERISRIVLCGGQSTLPGLVDFLQSYFDLPVELGNPWRNFFPMNEAVPELELRESLRYSTAIGLCLRSFEEIF